MQIGKHRGGDLRRPHRHRRARRGVENPGRRQDRDTGIALQRKILTIIPLKGAKYPYFRSKVCLPAIVNRGKPARRGQNDREPGLGRKNFLFAGSDAGGEVLAEAMTMIEAAKRSGLNPEAYLTNTLARIRIHDPRRLDGRDLDELLPWTWNASRNAAPAAA